VLARTRLGDVHDLRHAFATEALAGGMAVYDLARYMGTSARMIDLTTVPWRAAPRRRPGHC
jgi:hypothetical protein